MSLRSSDKARLRDWYDTSGTWVIKITSLYEIVDRIAEKTIERRLAPVREYIAQLDRAAEDNAARVYGADLVMASDVARVVAMSLRNALGDGCSDTTIPRDCRCLWQCGDSGDWWRLEQHPSCPAHPVNEGGAA